MSKSNRMLTKIVYVGIMAALIFAATHLLSFQIFATPPTMFKTANILCLLAGMLFGGWYGGLAAGIGSALFDLTSAFAIYSPYTLLTFFCMGAVCGLISHLGGRKGDNGNLNLYGAILGACANWLLYIAQTIALTMIAGSGFQAAALASTTQMFTATVNALIAVVGAMLLITPLRLAFKRAGILARVESMDVRVR